MKLNSSFALATLLLTPFGALAAPLEQDNTDPVFGPICIRSYKSEQTEPKPKATLFDKILRKTGMKAIEEEDKINVLVVEEKLAPRVKFVKSNVVKKERIKGCGGKLVRYVLSKGATVHLPKQYQDRTSYWSASEDVTVKFESK